MTLQPTKASEARHDAQPRGRRCGELNAARGDSAGSWATDCYLCRLQSLYREDREA